MEEDNVYSGITDFCAVDIRHDVQEMDEANLVGGGMKLLPYLGALIIGAGVFMLFKDKAPPTPDPTPVDVYPAPSLTLQSAVATVKAFHGKPKADTFALFLWHFADVLERDAETQIVKTVGQFQSGFHRADQLMFQRTDMVGALPGLSAAVSRVLVSELGREDLALDRGKAVATLRAMAWALGG